MRFESGYLSPYFVTDPDRMECVYEDVYVLIHERKISNREDLLPVLQNAAKTGNPLLIVAEEVEGEAPASLVFNKVSGIVKCVAVNAPGFGDRRKRTLEALAALTAGRVLAEDLGFKNVTLMDLGRANRVIVGERYTTIDSAAQSKN